MDDISCDIHWNWSMLPCFCSVVHGSAVRPYELSISQYDKKQFLLPISLS